ncbi:unnamed protein product, partial [Adineta steineri]
MDYLGLLDEPDPSLDEVDSSFFDIIVYNPLTNSYTERIRLSQMWDMAVRFAIALVREAYDVTDDNVHDQIYWYIMFIISADILFDPNIRHHVYKVAEHYFRVFKPCLIRRLNRLPSIHDKYVRMNRLNTNDLFREPQYAEEKNLISLIDTHIPEQLSDSYFSSRFHFLFDLYHRWDYEDNDLFPRRQENSTRKLLEPLYKALVEIIYARVQNQICHCVKHDVREVPFTSQAFDEPQYDSLPFYIRWSHVSNMIEVINNRQVARHIIEQRMIWELFANEVSKQEIQYLIVDGLSHLKPTFENQHRRLIQEIQALQAEGETVHTDNHPRKAVENQVTGWVRNIYAAYELGPSISGSIPEDTHSALCKKMPRDHRNTPTISKNLTITDRMLTRSQLKQKEIQAKKIKFQQFGITIAGGNEIGQELNQLNHPSGIFIDNKKSIYIADYYNHRIVKWKLNSNTGQIIAGRNGYENQNNQLSYPKDIIFDKDTISFIIYDEGNKRVVRYFAQNQRNPEILMSNVACYGLTIDKNGFIYVSDCENHEVRRWKQGDKEGKLVAGGNGQGNHLNQLHYPTYIFIDQDYSLYISDCYNDRVMKLKKDAKEGIIVASGNGQGNSLKQLNRPHGVIVDDLGHIYVVDWGNNRVMRWCEGDKEGEIIVGGNDQGNQSNQLYYPTGLSFDNEENLYVADSWNHR